MICGYNDWDAALDEAYFCGILNGTIDTPKRMPPPKLEDYGRSVTFTAEELMS